MSKHDRALIDAKKVRISSFVAADGEPCVEILLPGDRVWKMSSPTAVQLCARLFTAAGMAAREIEAEAKADNSDVETFVEMLRFAGEALARAGRK